MARDYYDVLGVGRDAGAEEIQAAYRRLARANHPDVNRDPAAEDRFKEVNEAYHVLSDPSTRRRYDRFGDDFRRVPEDWEEQVSRSGSRGGARGSREGGSGFGDAGFTDFGDSGFTDFGGAGVDIEDLLGGLFGRGRAGRPVGGADQEAELPLTVEEAYRGGRREVQLSGTSGPRTYTVTIPPGVVDGQRIRLGGEGGRGLGGGPAGDLYLVVRILPHERYRLVGRDIVVPLPLSPWEAALGATVPVTTPGGEVTVTVPPGSSTGRQLRLRGEGMPRRRGARGDLLAEISVLVPPRLTPRERELFSELADVSAFDPRREIPRSEPDSPRRRKAATS
ncbi:DnaJ domain-containing protein [Pseudonocardia sp. KRD-184]|uniref:DnaJ domain-containing protein n=1 Tax=Pseudonocardia oceani TaxID=2792013 RepID=A0ABS6UGX0_9PSEU|nr:DnaJ C-terminal domain-containing protein [Pseudonocardia oceani]MBW0088783.1 DnaJ domain-containing protein [Pseudonocardia oceani]MBW0096382.1 DnaJ domain-containing protein [Pseudonocardia oceani]MBW0107353.1 DnaJ domain-containing protein [Pseudonocardia oceani]MBW0122450.1 DnaJ domain-containing protein [Pseudonocardia oceani]MBW0131485.1 DnaJ domain-containing protein [Pseudonocardia oceani]